MSEMDRISNIPLSIVETILCLLPIQEAVRTSILSKEWRYRWIKIPKLEFLEEFQVPTDGAEPSDGEQIIVQQSKRQNMDSKSKLLYDISQVMLMHEGPIHEFVLFLNLGSNSCVEIDRIMVHLSRNTKVEKLKLDFNWGYRLPSSFFLLSQLTDLYLSGCSLEHQPTFSGFGSLTTLYVYELVTSTKTILQFLSSCPLLKTVTMKIDEGIVECSDDSTITNLFKCLPVVENLSIWRGIIECFAQDGVPHKLPTALVHLKYLFIDDICFLHSEGIPILFLLIRSSPNMEKLKVEITDDEICQERPKRYSLASPESLKGYSNIWLEHLTELEVTNFDTMKEEWWFVKLILAKSPMLKKLRISYHQIYIDEESQILEVLKSSRRASPEVEFILTKIEDDLW